MVFEKMQDYWNVGFWQITDEFGDKTHLTEKDLIALYNEIAKQIIYKDYRNDKGTSS